MKFLLENCRHILIFGAGRGIGLAMVQKLLERSPEAIIYATYRNDERAKELLKLADIQKTIVPIKLDPSIEKDYEKIAQVLEKNKLQLCLNCIGVLNDEKTAPEKSLRDINLDRMLYAFQINTTITALAAKYIDSHLSRKEPNIFATISAKVGSIEDNRMGGWYSYRASKSALNMILKCISIEFSRKKNNCIVLSIHPGTTRTDLSEDFIKNTTYKIHSPIQTAENILNQLEGKNLDDSGKFISWDGEELPW